MIWLAWTCQLVTLAVGVWIGYQRGYAAGRICGQHDALVAALSRRGARLARLRWERDRVEPEEGDDNDL